MSVPLVQSGLPRSTALGRGFIILSVVRRIMARAGDLRALSRLDVVRVFLARTSDLPLRGRGGVPGLPEPADPELSDQDQSWLRRPELTMGGEETPAEIR